MHAANLHHCTRCKEALALRSFNDCEVVRFQNGDEESVALILDEVIHSIALAISLSCETDRMMSRVVRDHVREE